MKKGFLSILLLLLSFALFAANETEKMNERCIKLVRTGSFRIYPDISVDRLFSTIRGVEWSAEPDRRRDDTWWVYAEGVMTLEGFSTPITFCFRIDIETASWRVDRITAADIEMSSSSDIGEIIDHLQMAQDKTLHPAIKCVRSGYFADSQYSSVSVGRMFDVVIIDLKWSAEEGARRNRFYVTASGQMAHNGVGVPVSIVFDVNMTQESWRVCEVGVMGHYGSSAWEIEEVIDLIDSIYFEKSADYY